MEAALFQTLVVHYVSATLPVQQFHYLATLAHEDIHVAIAGGKADASSLPAHAIDADAHVAGLTRHDDAVVLIQIKHWSFLKAKVVTLNETKKTARFGCLLSRV